MEAKAESPQKQHTLSTSSSPLSQTLSPPRKRVALSQSTPSPLKRRLMETLSPASSNPYPHDFWVSVWFNGNRVTDLTEIRTNADLASFKVTGRLTTCAAFENDGSAVYTDDNLWFKATIDLTPQAAATLLASPVVEYDHTIVIFAPYPCSASIFTQTDLEEHWEAVKSTASDLSPRAVVTGGRPFTWSIKKYSYVSFKIADAKKNRQDNPARHCLQEHYALAAELGREEADSETEL